MDKIETVERVIEERVHRFFCDDCGEFLGESTEWEDGYYREIGEFSTCYGCYRVKKHLCNTCRDKFENKLIQTLKDLGFQQ